VPERWCDERLFWERLVNPVVCDLEIKGYHIKLLVEPSKKGYVHRGLYQQQPLTGLQSIVMVYRRRSLWHKVTEETQFFLTSLPCDAQRIGLAHVCTLCIENQLHWVGDVTFSEDRSRIRLGYGPENFSLLRRLAIGVLNQETHPPTPSREGAKGVDSSEEETRFYES